MATELHDVPAMDKRQPQGYGTSVNEQLGKTRSDASQKSRQTPDGDWRGGVASDARQ